MNSIRHIFKPVRLLIVLLVLCAGLTIPQHTSAEEVILQYFGTRWTEITRRLPELAEAGYSALWLPPPFKGGSGGWSVGYDVYDRFDLGSKQQMGSLQTRYGTETELIHLVRMAHRFGFRVYFDNVMAHNGGPIITGEPGTLSNNGFVPEDFHLIRIDSNYYTKADWPNWNDEWQVLNRNPFGMDIAQEDPNDSFGWSEGDDYPKWNGVRHPYNPEYYPDTDLPLTFSNASTSVVYYTYANKEPFEDVGYTNSSGEFVSGAKWNEHFDWEDLNGNGQHDAGENSEPFEDTGIDPSRADRRVAVWGYGDGVYNMGNPYAEDVNAMLFRAARWFTDRVKPDGFRLDAVKHVPDYFFGKMDDPKDDSDWGYNGQIQAQFNITRGYSDWNNHRDTVFNNTQPRDDALLYGEHLGAPPSDSGYVSAGMRIANDNFLNAVKNTIGSSLSGLDSPYYGIMSPGQSMLYIMSHDNNYIWSGDREQAHAVLLTREGIPMVYTDGYNQSGEPDWFPKPAEVPFLGQFGNDWLPDLLDINRHFGSGYQSSRWSADNYVSYTRYDENLGNNDHGVTMVFALSKNYETGWPQLQGAAVFPDGARLFNYSKYDTGNEIRVENGNLVGLDGNPVYIPPNRYYAYSWRIPEMPEVWGDSLTNAVRPIMILQNGEPVENITVTRTDGRDGDPAFNPYGLPDDNALDYSYSIQIPRVTSATNLTFIARADGSAENILMKLDGGIDLNSQMDFMAQDYGTRDNPPAVSKDRFLGFEQMHYQQRGAEKFAAADAARNVIGSPGAETYVCTIGNAGVTTINGNGINTSAGTANWAYHHPGEIRSDGSSLQLSPAPAAASGQPLSIAVKVGYEGEANRAFIYYTIDGTDPDGSLGTGKDSTYVAELSFSESGANDGTGIPEWWAGTIPPQTAGTELRYKIGVYHNAAASRFPWSDDDLDVIPRMETRFEITDFNAATVPYYPDNDWGQMAVGLEDGFHILRTKALLGRAEYDTPIFRENTQTFYYDAETPNGRILWPEADGLTLDYPSYRVVLTTDMTAEEVWFRINDTDDTNDDLQTGTENGNGAWARAQKATSASLIPSNNPEQRWEFDYVNIPDLIGSATVSVILREITSSTNLDLSDSEGHFTTLTRTLLTDTSGSGARMYITAPGSDGQTLSMGDTLSVRFSGWLADELTSDQLLNTFTLQIDGETAVPLTSVISWNVTTNEHQLSYTLPNLYDGNPDSPHTLSIRYDRAGYPSLIASRQAFSNVNTDSNGDGIPDAWEVQWNLSPADLSSTNDYDGDGISDYLEYIANTDPTDSNMYFRISDSFMQTNGAYYSLIFNASYNREYFIWQTDSLAPPVEWKRYSGYPFSGTGQFTEFGVETGSSSNRFYRVEVSLPGQ
ncbi:MAG: hypothetical protein JXR25_16510 [Pontiellaceae bacterium]|nr:hypothetical protein [Pontiellaceae bacterium]MBN2786424.1 hypothetical protein [Pontiellaceae bacterium]